MFIVYCHIFKIPFENNHSTLIYITLTKQISWRCFIMFTLSQTQIYHREATASSVDFFYIIGRLLLTFPNFFSYSISFNGTTSTIIFFSTLGKFKFSVASAKYVGSNESFKFQETSPFYIGGKSMMKIIDVFTFRGENRDMVMAIFIYKPLMNTDA